MGQQQLLLVILVTILVGIATVVAINVFGSAAEDGNRDAVRQDLLQGAAGAQAIWIKPHLLGGAGRDFGTIPANIIPDGQDADSFILSSLGIPGILNAEGNIVNENAEYEITARTLNALTIQATPASWQNTITLRVCRDFTENEEGWKSGIDTDGGVPVVQCAEPDA